MDAMVEITTPDLQRSIDQFAHRPVYKNENKAAAEQTDDQCRADGEGHHLRAMFSQLRIDAIERQMGVDHSQNLALRRMSMTSGAAAIGRVLDGKDDGQCAVAVWLD